jgi:hypothetical protein
MFLVYETLLNSHSEIPELYADPNCCLVTGYPKTYVRCCDFGIVTFEQLRGTNTLLFELHTPDDNPTNVHPCEDLNCYIDRKVSWRYINRLEKSENWPYIERPSV